MGWSSDICLLTFRAYSTGPEQASDVLGDPSNTRRLVLAAKGVVSGAPESHCGSCGAPSFMPRLTQTAPLSSSAPEPPRAAPSCVATVQQFARHLGLSRGVANQLSLCRHQSSHHLYQHRWECYRAWCATWGHSVSSPTIAEIADFLLFLHLEKHLSVSAVKGYRFTHVSVCKYRLPEFLDSFVWRDLIRSFEIERPRCPVGPPSWDLVKVLTYLRGSVFEPLSSKPLRVVMMTVSFLLALATVRRVSEIQALSFRVASHGPDRSLAYLPEFMAKMESQRNPLPRSFLVRPLEEFVGDFPEEYLFMSCPCGLDLPRFDLDLIASPSVVVCFTPTSLALALKERLVVLSPPGDS